MLEALPPSVPASVARSAIMEVRLYGRGADGHRGLGGEDLALPCPCKMRSDITVRGRWAYGPVAGMLGLVRSGLLDLSHYAVTEFMPGKVNEAVAHAARNAGPFRLTVSTPGR